MQSYSKTSFVAGELIPAARRVKLTGPNTIGLAGINDKEIGVSILYSGKETYQEGEAVGVYLINVSGTITVTAEGAIATNGAGFAIVKRADNGMVSTTGGGDNFGVVFEDGADGDYLEALRDPSLLTTEADGSVTPQKLADAVADEIPTLAVAIANPGNGNANITIQAKDAQGNNLAAHVGIRAFFSATSYGAPTDLGTLTAAAGIILKADTADALITAVTDATGLLSLTYDLIANGPLFCMAQATGVYAAGNAAITGN